MSEFTLTSRHSPVERLLGIEFASDPTRAKIKLPEVPEDWDERYAYQVSAAHVTITPDMAYDIIRYRFIWREVTPAHLIHSEWTDNRGVSPLRVKRYASEELHPGVPHGLAFTKDGFCLDGQHRIAGAYLARKTIKLPMALWVPWSAFAVTDSGLARRAAQMLSREYPLPSNATTAARMIMPLMANEETFYTEDRSMTRQGQLDFVKSWPFFQSREWAKAAKAASKNSRIPLSPLYAGVAMALAAGHQLDWTGRNGNSIEWYISQFLYPLGLVKPKSSDFDDRPFGNGTDPRWLLREMFMDGKQNAAARGDIRVQVSAVRRSLAIWLNHEQNLSKLQLPSNDKPMTPVWQADAVREYAIDRDKEYKN